MPPLEPEERRRRAVLILRIIIAAGGSARSRDIWLRVNHGKHRLSPAQIRDTLTWLLVRRMVSSTPSGRGITVEWTITRAGREYLK